MTTQIPSLALIVHDELHQFEDIFRRNEVKLKKIDTLHISLLITALLQGDAKITSLTRKELNQLLNFCQSSRDCSQVWECLLMSLIAGIASMSNVITEQEQHDWIIAVAWLGDVYRKSSI